MASLAIVPASAEPPNPPPGQGGNPSEAASVFSGCTNFEAAWAALEELQMNALSSMVVVYLRTHHIHLALLTESTLWALMDRSMLK